MAWRSSPRRCWGALRLPPAYEGRTMTPPALSPDPIRTAYAALHGKVRRTPILEVDGADFGLPGITLVFKLEFLQHAGSFKTRGAFTHMLTREIPAAGV